MVKPKAGNQHEFALIGHHLSLDLLFQNLPMLKNLPLKNVYKILENTEPEKVADLTGVVSVHNGRQINGYGLSINLLPDQILNLDSRLIINKIIKAGQLAKNLGVKIIVLGAYTSVIGHQGAEIAAGLDIAVTTGNSYTAAAVIEAIKEGARLLGINLKKSKIVIVGATGSIGSVCSRILAEMSAEVVLIARNKRRLEKLADQINSKKNGRASVALDLKKAVSDADIVITTTSAPFALIDARDFKPGTLVCDVAVPSNVSLESGKIRNDVLIIEGGLIKPPGNLKESAFNIGLPPGIAPACLSEGMILAFENRFENYTIGLDIAEEKVKEIYQLGKKHGFALAGFRSFGRNLTYHELEKIKQNIISARK